MAQVTMSHHLMSMQCGLRALGHLSLVFGLLASGALSLAVATDFWLFTTEQLVPMSISNSQPSYAVEWHGVSSTASSLVDDDEDDDEAGDDDNDDDDADVGVDAAETGDDDVAAAAAADAVADLADVTPTDLMGNDTQFDDSMPSEVDDDQLSDTTMAITAKTHSGLWRSCLYWDESDFDDIQHPLCTNIVYFGQDNDRHDGADTTNSILRAIRKSSPVIVGSLLLMVTALTFSILGNSKRDGRTLIAAILYVCAALSLAVGIIFYISAVNDEVSHHKKTHSSTGDAADFSYRYGWAFFFAGSSFMCAMVAAVNNISLYLRRGLEPETDDDGDAFLQRYGGKDCVAVSTTVTSGGRKENFGLLQSSPTAGQRHHLRLHHVNITTPV